MTRARINGPVRTSAAFATLSLLAACGGGLGVNGWSQEDQLCVATNAALAVAGGDFDAKPLATQIELILTTCRLGRTEMDYDATAAAIATALATERKL